MTQTALAAPRLPIWLLITALFGAAWNVFGLIQLLGAINQTEASLMIGWGKLDRLSLPRQATRAIAACPSGTLHWFEHSRHFPIWDMLPETTPIILKTAR